MNSLIHQIPLTKTPFSPRKFITSLSTFDNPPKSTANNSTGSIPNHIDPHQIIVKWNQSKVVTIKDVTLLHTHLIKTAHLHSHIFFPNSLIDWYWKLSAIDYALQLFDEMPNPNFISWNIMISGHNHCSLYDGACRYFCRMRLMGFPSNQFTYGSVISACAGLGSSVFGKSVYSLSIKDGFFSNGYIRSGMIDLFAKKGCFEDALRVFYDCSDEENAVCWNSIISGAVRNGDHWRAIEIFDQMRHGAVVPSSFTLSSVLTACVALGDGDLGKKVHGLVIKHGEKQDVFVGTNITDLYSKCGDMVDAMKNFLRMPVRNVVSWTAMIAGFVRKDDPASAVKLFGEMRKSRVEVNKYTITSLLSACAKSNMIIEALQIHSWILKSGFHEDSTVTAALMNAYSKVGEVHLSELLYLEHEESEDVEVCGVMISSFAQNHKFEEATRLFQRMLLNGLKPDNFSVSSILSITDRLNVGRQLHSYTLKTGLVFDLSVGSSLFTMYSKCGSLVESYEIFLQLPHKDSVSWTSMIFGFAEHGYANKAIELFREMLSMVGRPIEMTLIGVLTACSSFSTPSKGKEVHGYAFRVGISGGTLIGGALVNMYSKCGAIDLARRVFDTIPNKDQVMFSALVSGYAQKGNIEEALSVFHEMLVSDLEVDSYTVSSILGSEALLNKTNIGIQLHALVIKLGLQSVASVGSSLIKMYSKLGTFDDCQKAFDQIIKPDIIGWTTMILSYAQHGKGEEALRLYDAMKSEGIKPDCVTFVGVLTACSHNGLVEEGYFHLNSMSKDYGIEPGIWHYACMVDLLGRSGRLKEAERMINEMPVKADALIWGTLLAACKVHGDVELGRVAAKKVFELKPCDSGAYISLSNILAEMGQWEEVEEVRTLMKGTGLSKEPGWSYM